LPLRCPTMMAFGGADLRTLYITSAGARRPAAERERYPLSGCVLSIRVEVPGLPEPEYLA
ncbi:MAG: Gluconolactonase, partial [Massilia sp.]|nr:Gluconolactonase [Massilia sp.]